MYSNIYPGQIFQCENESYIQAIQYQQASQFPYAGLMGGLGIAQTNLTAMQMQLLAQQQANAAYQSQPTRQPLPVKSVTMSNPVRRPTSMEILAEATAKRSSTTHETTYRELPKEEILVAVDLSKF